MVLEMTNLDVSEPIPSSMAAGMSAAMAEQASEEDIDGVSSPVRGPPSETSSQEWDQLTDPGSQSTA